MIDLVSYLVGSIQTNFQVLGWHNQQKMESHRYNKEVSVKAQLYSEYNQRFWRQRPQGQGAGPSAADSVSVHAPVQGRSNVNDNDTVQYLSHQLGQLNLTNIISQGQHCSQANDTLEIRPSLGNEERLPKRQMPYTNILSFQNQPVAPKIRPATQVKTYREKPSQKITLESPIPPKAKEEQPALVKAIEEVHGVSKSLVVVHIDSSKTEPPCPTQIRDRVEQQPMSNAGAHSKISDLTAMCQENRIMRQEMRRQNERHSAEMQKMNEQISMLLELMRQKKPINQ